MHYAIIAAGEGSRLVSEGVPTPKPLVPLCGVPMIERLIDIFMRHDPEGLSVIVNEQMTEVRTFLQALAATLPVPLRLVVKSTPSSMHSFYEVSRGFEAGQRFCLTTVDTIFRDDDFGRYIAAFDGSDADAMMAVTPYVDDEKPLYVATDAGMRVTAFLDAPQPGVEYVSGGVYGLTAPCLDVLARCLADGVSRMRNYQRALVAAGLDIRAFAIPEIMDVDHADDIKKAEAFLTNKNNGCKGFTPSQPPSSL